MQTLAIKDKEEKMQGTLEQNLQSNRQISYSATAEYEYIRSREGYTNNDCNIPDPMTN